MTPFHLPHFILMKLPSWLKSADSILLNSIAWRISAVLAVSISLTAAYLHLSNQHPVGSRSQEVASSTAAAPSGTASNGQAVTDTNRRIEFCRQHVTADRSFVVFRNGTCVIVNEPCEDPIQSAIELVKECSGPDARFITRQIEAESYMVTYRQPVFHCLFGDEVEQLGPVVESGYTSFLSPEERQSRPIDWEPPFDAKIGLLTRTFLNADARELKVAKVIRALPVPQLDDYRPQASTSF